MRVAVVMLVAGVTLSGCGGSDSTGSVSTPAATGVAPIPAVAATTSELVPTVTEPTAAEDLPTRFPDAVIECGLLESEFVTLADGGTTLVMKGSAILPDVLGLSPEDVGCVLNTLDVPDSVGVEMLGMEVGAPAQTASWADITMTWIVPDASETVTFALERECDAITGCR